MVRTAGAGLPSARSTSRIRAAPHSPKMSCASARRSASTRSSTSDSCDIGRCRSDTPYRVGESADRVEFVHALVGVSREPNTAKCLEVTKISYSPGVDAGKQVFEDLALLEVQVISGDREAVRLGFRLLKAADGHVAETLDIMLGRLIRVRPRLFLEESKASGAEATGLVNLVGNFGEPYIDRETAAAYEGKARISALQTVWDSSLSAVPDSCIRVLQHS